MGENEKLIEKVKQTIEKCGRQCEYVGFFLFVLPYSLLFSTSLSIHIYPLHYYFFSIGYHKQIIRYAYSAH